MKVCSSAAIDWVSGCFLDLFFFFAGCPPTWLASVHIYVLALAADGRKGTKGRNRRGSMRHGIGVKGGRRGSMAIDKNWEAINKVSPARPSPEDERPSSAKAQKCNIVHN